jgi:hypothetical protein
MFKHLCLIILLSLTILPFSSPSPVARNLEVQQREEAVTPVNSLTSVSVSSLLTVRDAQISPTLTRTFLGTTKTISERRTHITPISSMTSSTRSVEQREPVIPITIMTSITVLDQRDPQLLVPITSMTSALTVSVLNILTLTLGSEDYETRAFQTVA